MEVQLSRLHDSNLALSCDTRWDAYQKTKAHSSEVPKPTIAFFVWQELHELSCLVLDELHMIGEGRRGQTLELLLAKVGPQSSSISCGRKTKS